MRKSFFVHILLQTLSAEQIKIHPVLICLLVSTVSHLSCRGGCDKQHIEAVKVPRDLQCLMLQFPSKIVLLFFEVCLSQILTQT